MKMPLWLLCVLMGTGLPIPTLAEIPLLEFCLGEAPKDDKRLEYFNNTCPSVITLAEQQGKESAQASSDKAKADLEKAQLENLAAAFPTQTPAAAKDTDIKGFKHFAEFRQVSLLHSASANIYQALVTYYEEQPPSKTRLVTRAEIASLRANTLPVETLTEELKRFNTQVVKASAACLLAKPKAKAKASSRNYSLSSGGLVAADALFGFALKISQAFQTNLGAAEGAALAGGANEVLAAGIASRWVLTDHPLYFGLPSITNSNPVVETLRTLRASTEVLIAHMGKAGEKSPCVVDGKALLEGIQSRLVELNKSPDAATPSPMLITMRWAELEPSATAKIPAMPSHFLILDALHSGGSVASTKSSFTSQRITAIATVMASYRLESIDAQLLSGGVFTCPSDRTGLDAVRYTKEFKTDSKISYTHECS